MTNLQPQKTAAREANIPLNSLEPIDANIDKHPYRKLFEAEFDKAKEYNLQPTIYFFEALAYHQRAQFLQTANLMGDAVGTDLPKENLISGDDLQDNVKIYDTVKRWFAGFSNAPQEMFLGEKNPKHIWNSNHGLPLGDGIREKFDEPSWFYLLYVHRVCGSGASFSKIGDKLPPHGWYNSPLPYLCLNAPIGENYFTTIDLLKKYDKPMFSSVGNQIAPFNKISKPEIYRNGGHEYLCEIAPRLTAQFRNFASQRISKLGKPLTIQEGVDLALELQSSFGWKKFKFVITAWVMDLAEYFPQYIDPNSNCYHGKNAQEAISLCFRPIKLKKQDFYDKATRMFADLFGTRPMDVEDAAPGCDLVRFLENYIKPGTYLEVDRAKIFNSSFIRHPNGRQRWKLGTSDWIW